MKIILLISVSTFVITTLHADKNWIKINPINETKSVKPKTVPVNKMIEKASIIKELLDKTRKEQNTKNQKNWFVLSNENTKD